MTARSAESPPPRWEQDRQAIDSALDLLCQRHVTGSSRVAQAIRYALRGGGKRLRGLLFLAAFRAAEGRGDASLLAAAIEVVHAYSLVHDDLPCMDDDDMRRGSPTVHRAFDVETATVAGVAMVPLAVCAALDGAAALGLDETLGARIVAELMDASGAGGMIGGQMLDLEGEGRPMPLEELERLHRAKTGALIRVSVVLAGLAGEASSTELAALAGFGDRLGLAFQIADDVLDVTGSTEVLGKTAGRDVVLQKSTYPALLGVGGATERAAGLVAQARSTLAEAGLLTRDLDAIAGFVVARSF